MVGPPDPATTEWVPIWNPLSEGPVGPIGPVGPEGDVGPQGPIGNTGAQGPIGNTGAQGPKGDTGNTGAQGTQGPQGVQGPTGPAGPMDGPASAINDNVVAFSGTTGKLVKDSLIPSAQVARLDTANIFTQNQFFTKSGPGLILNDTSQAVDAKKFRIINASQLLYIQALNDAESLAPGYLQISRAGVILLQTGGINFPAAQVASAAANELDDYEEGTFLPQFHSSAGNWSGFTYNIQTGYYIKIGSLVTIVFDISASVIGTGPAGTLIVGNLPFLSHGSIGSPGGGYVNYFANFIGPLLSIFIAAGAGTNYVLFYYKTTGSGTAEGPLQMSNLSVACRFVATVTYRTSQ